MIEKQAYGPTTRLPVRHPAPTRRSRWALVVGLGLAVASVAVYAVGLATIDDTAPACERWVGCTATARDQWSWDAKPWASAALAAGVLVAWFASMWSPISARPVLRKVASVLGLVALVPVTIVFALVFVTTWSNTCTESSSWCFSGPEAAMIFGSPAFVAGPLVVLMAVGLIYPDSRVGRACSTLALTLVTGLLVVAVAELLFSIDWTG